MTDIGRLSTAWGAPVKMFFDVGANIGQTSRAALARFPEASVTAFEPFPPSFDKLAMLADRRFAAHRLALGDVDGRVELFVYGSLLNSVTNNARYPVRFGERPRDTLQVQCTRLDGFCQRAGTATIDVLKIDTEGHELAMLHGADKMLSEGRVRFVYAEFNDLAPKPGTAGGAYLPLAQYLADRGFSFVATYIDHVVAEGELFVAANGLFARQPSRT
jgi:FkbM family methyltransferase